MNKLTIALLFAAIVAACPALAVDHTGHGKTGAAASTTTPVDREKRWKESLAKPSFAVTASFDENGKLWLAAIRGQHVYVSYSDDRGVTQSVPVTVNTEPENILGDGENRPKIIVRKGVIYVSYTQGLAKPMTGHIRFSRSLDGGKTFSPPVTVNDNLEIISHRFDVMGVNSRGQVFIAWLDKRDLSAAAENGEEYAGLGLYYAVSDDAGRSFRPNIKAADHACECCRVAMAMDTDGYPVVVWRHVYDTNIRDHALVKLDGKMAPVRLSHENWNVAGCPHHGPSLSIAADGVYHATWFSNAPERQGLFYAHSADQGKTFSAPLNFGNPEAQPAHPYVLSLGSRVYLVWKEFDGENTGISGMHSGDGGKSWSAPEKLASTSDVSDWPMLIGTNNRAYLSWNTKNEGYRLIEIGEENK
ncbi:MAG: exo-alpha-sialidase [Nitrosomonadales bacterium]|nr:exo-alpha-sialidase [Nitrosomonadales bacterium]